jgi:excisionase family DNA binding protein
MTDLLTGFVPAKQLATDLNKTYRTILYWMAEANGLPYIQLGNQRLIHPETVRAWLISRTRQRNPDRHRRGRKR